MPGKCHKAVTTALSLFRGASAPGGVSLTLTVLAGHAHEVLPHPALAIDLGHYPVAVLGVFGDLGELTLGLLDLVAGRVDVDLPRLDGLFYQDLDEVFGHLEETVGGGEDVELLAIPDAHVPDLGGRDERGVVNHHPDVAVRYAGHDEVRLPVVDHLLGRDGPPEELPAPAPLLPLFGQPSLPGRTRRPERSSAHPGRSRPRRFRPPRGPPRGPRPPPPLPTRPGAAPGAGLAPPWSGPAPSVPASSVPFSGASSPDSSSESVFAFWTAPSVLPAGQNARPGGAPWLP